MSESSMRAAKSLTEAQMGIWLGQQLNPCSPMYNAAEIIDIQGEIDVPAFDDVVCQLMQEAEALQMVFREENGKVSQFRQTSDDVLEYVDVSECVSPDQQAKEIMRQRLAQPVDLSQGPLFQQILFKLDQRHYQWYQQIHHIAADGYAFNLLTQRCIELYNHRHQLAISGGARSILTGKVFSGIDAVIQEDRQYQAAEDFQRDRDYWMQALQGMQNPCSFSGSPAPINDVALHQSCMIDAVRLASIKQICAGLQCNWTDYFISLVAYLLYRKLSCREVVLGIPVMGRMGSASLRVPTMVMNIIPLRICFSELNSFRDLLMFVSQTLRCSMPHQRYRYEQLRRDMGAVGGERRLFGPVVNVMPFDRSQQFSGAQCRSEVLSAGPVDDISFNFIVDQEQNLRFDLHANPRRYDRDELVALQNHLIDQLTVLSNNIYQPLPTPVRKLSYIEAEPLNTRIPLVMEMFVQQVQESPQAIALIDGDQQLSYVQLYERCIEMANNLRSLAINSEKPIALMLSRGTPAIVSCLALVMCGRAYLFVDPQGPASRNESILLDADIALLICDDEKNISNEETHPCITYQQLINQQVKSDALSLVPNSQAIAYLVYTSGSTGKPKGVVISQEALAEFVIGASQSYGINDHDRILQFAPLHFDASVEEIFLSLCNGATLVMRNQDMLDSFQVFLEQCAVLGITVLDLPTAYWHELVYYGAVSGCDLPAVVRTVIIGGEAAQQDRVHQWHKINRHDARLLNTYGPSEATVVASCAVIDSNAELSIGRPLPGRQIAVVDHQQQLVPMGEPGELVLLGAGLASGYLHEAEMDNSGFRFFKTPASNVECRSYFTGDLVRINSQENIEYLGRVDDEIKLSGHRINPLEVEAAIVNLEYIEQVAVIAPRNKQGDRYLAVAIVSDVPVDIAILRQHLAERLPAAMLPSSLLQLAHLPKNTSGKIDRRQLLEAFSSQDDNVHHSADIQFTMEQRLIVDIWQQVLGRQGIGIDDDFFLLGGQSLQTLQVVNRLTEKLQQDIPVSLLFQYPTPRELAMAIVPASQAIPVQDNLYSRVLQDCELELKSFPVVNPPVLESMLPDTAELIVLTGATGFLGVQLLYQLLQQTTARIVCLVRDDGSQPVKQKILSAMKNQGLPCAAYEYRIEAVNADLQQENLGLSELQWHELAQQADAIWHNAAVTSVMRNYDSLRAVNLMSTRELLRMAAPGRVPIHYVSTIAIAEMAFDSIGLAEAYQPWHEGLHDGYQQTKWASEKILHNAEERGYPVSIYRLGRISGDSENGFFNTNDLVWRILLASLNLELAPDIDFEEPWTPVNQVAEAMVGLARYSDSGAVYNMTPSHQVSLQQLFSWLREEGYHLPNTGMKEWMAALQNSERDDNRALAGFFMQQAKNERATSSMRIENTRFTEYLSQSGMTTPKINQQIFSRYLRYAWQHGIVAPPVRHSSGEIHREQA